MTNKPSNRKYVYALAVATGLWLTACGKTSPVASELDVTDVDHSTVKRQAIGNCWLYAAASWTESLHKSATGEELNISESYWTWWHFYDQLVNSSITEISTGGWWSTSTNIILRHGYVLEGEFIPNERDSEMSYHQSAAEAAINAQLQAGGTLATAAMRTPANVRAALDAAFGTNMAAAEQISRPANRLETGRRTDGSAITLQDSLVGATDRWTYYNYPIVYGQNAVASAQQQYERKNMLLRVMRALNAAKPVVISFSVDFNALDATDGGFKADLLTSRGPGRQGGHMLVGEDYVVDNVPGVGSIEEGNYPDQYKQLALQGTVRYIKVKNSWGSNRPERGLTDGYNRLYMNYLDKPFEWISESTGASSFYSPLHAVILPPGY